MSRPKSLILPLALTIALLWSLQAAAKDPTPNTCLELDGKCYASNQILPGTRTETDADGTAMAPWPATTDQEMLNLRNAVTNALDNNGYGEEPFFFAQIICDAGGCQTTWYKYDEEGQEIRHWADPGIPPEVGVSLPFPYILGGGAALGALLIGAGIVLRRKARSTSPRPA
jgi:hypothetical protein